MSVTLDWRVVNATEGSTFAVLVAMGTSAFVLANEGTAIDLAEPGLVVRGLFPNTAYRFAVAAIDTRGNAPEAVIATSTYISRTLLHCISLFGVLTVVVRAAPSGLRLEEATETSLSFSWVASAHATLYSSYIRTVSGATRSDVTIRFTHVADFPASTFLGCISAKFCMFADALFFVCLRPIVCKNRVAIACRRVRSAFAGRP